MNFRLITQLSILLLWVSYCVALTLAAPVLDLDAALFALFAPACAALGFLVPRHASLLAPVALAPLLALLAWHAYGSSGEEGAGFFYAIWFISFAAPGVVAVAFGAGLRVSGTTAPGSRRRPRRRGPRAPGREAVGAGC